MDKLAKLYEFLQKQAEGQPVEILTLIDNKAMTIGQKRNMLLSCARGKYLAFLDDDDMVSEDYISQILFAIRAAPNHGVDVIAFRQHCTVNGKTFHVDFGLGNSFEPVISDDNGNYKDIKRPPYHMCAWRSIIAKNTPFPDISYGEDAAWISQMIQRCKSQWKTDKILHYYRYDDKTSESIQFRK